MKEIVRYQKLWDGTGVGGMGFTKKASSQMSTSAKSSAEKQLSIRW